MARCRRAPAALAMLLLSLALCSGSRSLQQSVASGPGGLLSVMAPATATTAAAQAAAQKTLQLAAPDTEATGGSMAMSGPASAPATQDDSLAAPAAAPVLAASGPLPAGIVSLAKRKNSNKKKHAAVAAENANLATLSSPTTPQGTGDYAEYAGIQDANSGLLPGGYTNNPKVSASALAASQQVNAANEKQQLASDVTQVVGANVSPSDAAAAVSALGEQIKVHPTDMTARTVQQVNADAPTYTSPQGVSVKPVLKTVSQAMSSQQQLQQGLAQEGALANGQQPSGGGGGSNSRTAKQRTTTASGQPLDSVQSATGLDGESITGDYISSIVGVRIATPLFGTGFNFCIDRYFDSFPKVGIVIPNAGAWLLPEFQDLANTLEHTLDLPTILPHGARIDPTSDGFLLWLPSFQPSEVPDFGIRYGIQLGQAFGYDFGYGIIRDICLVSFVTV